MTATTPSTLTDAPAGAQLGRVPDTLTALAPDEVVTHALTRDVQLPGGAGVMALITLDNGRDHTRPTTLGPAGLAELGAVLDGLTPRAAAGEIVAVGVTGKPFFFCAGADLSAAGRVVDRDAALAIGRYGHDVLRRFGELAVPSFAFVNGAALGGGVELALHCTYRTISLGVPAVGLPECFLGLLPGWGGTYLLPRLVGPAKALDVIISNALNNNKMLNGAAALALGVADAGFDPVDFLEQSLAWAARVVQAPDLVRREDVDLTDEPAWADAVSQARRSADAKVHGAAPAPYTAIDLVDQARTADRDAGFEAESQGLAGLIMSEEFRASLYAFDLVNKRAKRPVGAPDAGLARPVSSVGIVGAGLMATQLALLFARRLEVPVVLTDLDAEKVAKGVALVHGEVDRLAAKGRIGPDAANKLKALVTGTTDKAGFAPADLVIEAVFESLDVKRQVFAELETIVSEQCVLMTNTSSLSVSAMAAGLAHPERVVGFHFFNPVAVMPLLEIVRAERTDQATLATAFAVGKKLRKSCVLVADAPAFVVNRLLARFMGEVQLTVDEGTPIEVADQGVAPLGLPMPPFVLLQLVGPAVSLHVAEIMHEAFPDRYQVSESLRAIVKAGRAGVYSWDAAGKPYVDEQTQALLVQGDRPLTPEQVLDRALSALAQECRIMLDDGVVAEPQDIDLCLLLGTGWPFHLGGITPYLDRTGVAERVTGRRFLPVGVAGLPA